ncbi:MAG: phage tail sheath protein FI [Phenylobacterium sp.]|jgi:phage tail sheath protein FI
MDSNITTPGIRVVETQTLPPSVAPVSTAVPAFIGYVALANGDMAHINQPVRVATLEEYKQVFGTVTDADQQCVVTLTDDHGKKLIGAITGPLMETTMYYNLRLYFDNGGGACYIVPVERGVVTKLQAYQNALAALATESAPTLIVIVQNDLQPTDYHTLVTKVLQQCQTEQDRFGIFDLVADATLSVLDQAQAFREAITTDKDQLKYGAVYYPALNTRYSYEVDPEKIKVLGWESREANDDNALKAANGSTGQSRVEEVIARNLGTLKQVAKAVVVPTTSLTADQRQAVDLSSANIPDDLRNKIIQQVQRIKLTLPASAAVAGVYAKTDNERGVWKAPANVALNHVISPVVKVTNAQNGALNVDPDTGKSINVIRDFNNQGILIWGARTLAGNDNEWRYVPVRRLFNFIEESVKKSTAYAVFEPNDAMLWLKIKASVVGFLTELWRQGALAGAQASDAFFVEVGLGKTMTPQDILEGHCIVKIGIAAVRPAEFIELEFTHHLQQ